MLRFRSTREAAWTAACLLLGAGLAAWLLLRPPPPAAPEPLPRLAAVLERGTLRVATVSNPLSYLQVEDTSWGLEYDLAREFADFLGVELEMVVEERFSDLLAAVADGRVDLAAAGITVTKERSRLVRFGPPYLHVTQELVVRPGLRMPETPEQLPALDLRVLAGSSYEETLLQLAESIPELRWEAVASGGMDDLFEALSRRAFDATIADSTLFDVSQRFFPRLRRAFSLTDPQPVAWALARGPDLTLLTRVRSFFQELSDAGRLDRLRDRHLAHVSSYDRVNTPYFLRHVRTRLARLRGHFLRAAEATGIDWKLLAAVAYQESHWDPTAVSATGVKGIMMLTRATAAELGVSDRENAAESIMAGARYLARMREKIPARIEEPDRTWLALAAYNVGFGHLEDARIITQRRGGNPDRWRDVARHLPLLSDPGVYRRTRHGYARGSEPVRHVQNVRSYYDILNWALSRELAFADD